MSERRLWMEMVQLRGHIDYLILYRQRCEKIERGIEMFLAVTSSGSIAAWAIWQEFSMLWGAIIAMSHLLSAAKSYLPFEKRLASATELSSRFESLFVRWEFIWQKVESGRLSEEEVFDHLSLLKKTKIDIQSKGLKGISLPDDPRLLILAGERAEAYFAALYSVGDLDEQGERDRATNPAPKQTKRRARSASGTRQRTDASN